MKRPLKSFVDITAHPSCVIRAEASKRVATELLNPTGGGQLQNLDTSWKLESEVAATLGATCWCPVARQPPSWSVGFMLNECQNQKQNQNQNQCSVIKHSNKLAKKLEQTNSASQLVTLNSPSLSPSLKLALFVGAKLSHTLHSLVSHFDARVWCKRNYLLPFGA